MKKKKLNISIKNIVIAIAVILGIWLFIVQTSDKDKNNTPSTTTTVVTEDGEASEELNTEIIESVTPSDYEETDVVSNNSLHKASVVRVVDGDTLIVNIDSEEIRLRMLEVDTPESVHVVEEKNNEFGETASMFTKSYIHEGDTVYLEYGPERVDKYSRLLAYVWLSDEVDLNKSEDIQKYLYNYILVANGYARVTSYAPNTKRNQIFTEAMKNAMDHLVGLWRYEEYWGIAGYDRENIPEELNTIYEVE